MHLTGELYGIIKVLRADGEKWTKDTANYCMLVATLITTMVFAATFTVPGGSNQDRGTPIFLKTKGYLICMFKN